ncbi:hypothetical protein ACI65C_012225 [Semiaphis heraclei]
MNKSSQSNLSSWISTEPKSKKRKIDSLEISSNNQEEVEGQCNTLDAVKSVSMLDIGKFLNGSVKSVNNEIAIPRINSRQTKRINIKTNDPEEYFRISIYIPLLDDFIQQLNERFNNKKDLITSLQNVIPKFCINKKYEDIKPCVDFYIDDECLLQLSREPLETVETETHIGNTDSVSVAPNRIAMFSVELHFCELTQTSRYLHLLWNDGRYITTFFANYS